MKKELVIVSGPSGSGISSARFVFEELNYYIIENLPSSLVKAVLEDFKNSEYPTNKFALLVNLDQAGKTYEIAKSFDAFDIFTVLFTTEKDELLKRYALTRHAHPRCADGKTSLEQAIDADVKHTDLLVEKADYIINTSALTVKDLRHILTDYLTHSEKKNAMVVNFISFGLKNGMPSGIDMLFDVRNIPNPYWVEELKSLTGYDKPVVDYMMSFPATKELLDEITNFLDKYLAEVQQNGRYSYTIGVACSGGQHRSTFVAKYLGERYSKEYTVHIIHRDTPELNNE